MSNSNVENLLKKAAEQLRKAGAEDLAKQVDARCGTLSNVVVMDVRDDRIFLKSPDPGYKRRVAFAAALRSATLQDGKSVAKYEGKEDPELTGVWSIPKDDSVLDKVKGVYGDFFCQSVRIPLVDSSGNEVELLPKSTYQKSA